MGNSPRMRTKYILMSLHLKNRDKEGPLVVFDNKKILFITHSLCRGTNTNRLKKGGNGDTPTGKTKTTYEPKNM